jgi:S1-C subfamily serine protease
MANEGGQKRNERDRVDRIRSRADELANSGGASDLPLDAAEMLAGFRDGVLSLDSVNETSLEHCLDSVGLDAVLEALLERAPESDETTPVAAFPISEDSGKTSGTEASVVPFPAPALRPASRWKTSSVWVGLAAAAVVLAVSGAIFLSQRSRFFNRPATVARVTFEWPQPQFKFNPATFGQWGGRYVPLAGVLPDFNKTTGTLGVGGDDRLMGWRLATVIVGSSMGWGSGAFISPDGWLLTNYHVVAGAAQEAALTGTPAKLKVITAHVGEDRIKPEPAVNATLYRADPVSDLALLKLDDLPAGRKTVPFFRLAQQVRDGESCYVVGSQNNGPAWWIRSGNVSQQFDYPADLSQYAVGAASTRAEVQRDRATVIVTDTRISSGDSGGPLLNANGELIGLTFATPENMTAGSVGRHIALRHLRAFVANSPGRPEGVPFDIWTAGLRETSMLEPQLADGDDNGKIDSLVYRYAQGNEERAGEARAAAITVFVDFAERSMQSKNVLDRIPHGLWGMEDRGRFRFDVLLALRADGVVALGYTNSGGVVDDIRIGRAGQETATVMWRRSENGLWSAISQPVPLIDPTRISAGNLERFDAIVSRLVGASSERRTVPNSQ